MPDFLPPEFVWFELRGDQPVIHLTVDVPEGLESEGWSLMNRTTLCLVDGPGDVGYMIPRFGIDAPPGWDDAITRASGSLVIFGHEPDTRSRFVRSV